MGTATVLGNVGGAHDVVVDRRGGLALPPGAGPALDWWVGAADRWHHPAEEAGTAVTQQRVDGLPVVETAMRVPGGQVVHRAWAVAAPGGADVVVVELENRSKEPVAVAAVVRGQGGPVRFDGDRVVTVGDARLVLGRRPARVAAGDDDAVRAALAAGEGDPSSPTETRQPVVALVFPLAHTARLRWVVPVDPGGASFAGDPDGLPDAEAVARGWRGHVEAGARVGVPDDDLTAAIVAARTTLLIRADRGRDDAAEIATVAHALDAWGHHDAAGIVLRDLDGHQRLNGRFGRKGDGTTEAVLAAWGAHARATGDAAWAEPLAEPAAKAAHRAAKDASRRAGGGDGAGSVVAVAALAQLDAAAVLVVAGEPEAADLCRERMAVLAGSVATAPAPAPAPALAFDGATGVDDVATARFLLDARRLLVDDTIPEALTVLPSFPDDWLGRDVEAHRVPTRAGTLSFALRWHGARPALLWELDARSTTSVGCGLDPSWSSNDPVGEALLGPVEPAGGLPKVVAPLPTEHGTAAGDAPDAGESFG